MSTDDKLGIGAGLTALGLAAALILLAQILPEDVLKFLPHREFNRVEAIFDGIVCLVALPAGLCFFFLGAMFGSQDQETDQ